jgi:putative resolvase
MIDLMAKQGQKLLRVGAAAHELGLHPMTVRRWIKAGRIQAVQVGREVRVPRSEIERIVGAIDGRLLVLYGRVSGRGQLDDLQRLLKLVCEDKVAEIAITYQDRLTRFGQEFLETLFSCSGVTLTVLDPGEEQTPEQELTADLLALIASFSGRLYGMRSHKQKELLKCAQAVITSP